MSHVTVYPENQAIPELELTDPAAITAALAELGVRFQRVDASVELAEGAGQDEVLSAYAGLVSAEKAAHGYLAADVIRLPRGAPDTGTLRQKFLNEHIHAEDEARLFVEGSGCFYLHLNQRIYRAVLERGDYISVPAGTKHWFDMGPDPFFAAIRLFTNPEGWVAQFTGDEIAQRFPLYE